MRESGGSSRRPEDFAPYLPTPPVIGDIDGDGQEEIIIGTYDPSLDPSNGSLYIFALDGTQKAVIPVPGGLSIFPLLPMWMAMVLSI